MVRHSFTYNGVDMREVFGLIVERSEDRLAPSLRPRKVPIPEKDGAHDFGAKYYEERELTIHCASPVLTRLACRELSAVISRKGRIVLWDEPDKTYVGQLYDPTDIERIAGRAKRFAMSFICEPFAYGETINEPMPVRYAYPGSARTPTLVEIVNTGTAAIQGVRLLIRKRSESI